MAERTPLDYEPAPPPRDGRLNPRMVSWVLLIMISAAVALGLTAALLPHPHSRPTANGAKCANNLRQIGLACSMYAKDFGHAFPDGFTSLVASQRLTADVLVCSASADVRAAGSTPAQQAAGLAMPDCCSYIYVGAPLTDRSSADCVVAWEDPANHNMEGANVLYADAIVVFEPLTTVVQLVPELEAGHNPPTIARLSQTQAEALYAKSWTPKLTAMKTGVWAAGLPRPTTQPAPGR